MRDVIFFSNCVHSAEFSWNPTVCQRTGGVSSYITSSAKDTFVQTCNWSLVQQKADYTFTCFGKQERAVDLRHSDCSRSWSTTMWPLDFLLGFDLKALLLFFFVLLLFIDLIKYRNPPNYPPGPLALPFVGSFFSVDNTHSHNYFTKVEYTLEGHCTWNRQWSLRFK